MKSHTHLASSNVSALESIGNCETLDAMDSSSLTACFEICNEVPVSPCALPPPKMFSRRQSASEPSPRGAVSKGSLMKAYRARVGRQIMESESAGWNESEIF
eukprot:CAMPEP_0113678270 /NCGR_PEP_ID=MMETSP0038_2-20120614/9832_1 /TAXON_ID=2898 /ORGANISM="Cryptomonas paramecium" /LENGTH=101 /DNA_ID=CAMNT_0000595845 /DNA_START=109 /DNA_END=414 /DNA_ORIENTATION=+ /assembly_acc=CAM_ASM_000170